jgi:hypothetical protein
MKSVIFKYSLFMALLFLAACGSDDNSEAPDEVALVVKGEVSEFPSEGEVFATINSRLSGDLTYTLNTISRANAFDLDGNTGVLTVKDPMVFDFETTTTITGQVSVSNGSETEIWSLEAMIRDMDDIAFWLTDSQTAYEMENTGNWVMITEEEYGLLDSKLSGVSKSGTTDLLFQQGTSATNFSSYNDFTIANDLSSIPNESYVFAFRYLSSSENATGNKVKVTAGGVTDTYTDVGNPLPNHGTGIHFFVLKGAEKITAGDRGFLGFYSQEGLSYDNEGLALGTHYAEQGDNNTFGTESIVVEGVCMYQGLSTTVRQWN